MNKESHDTNLRNTLLYIDKANGNEDGNGKLSANTAASISYGGGENHELAESIVFPLILPHVLYFWQCCSLSQVAAIAFPVIKLGLREHSYH